MANRTMAAELAGVRVRRLNMVMARGKTCFNFVPIRGVMKAMSHVLKVKTENAAAAAASKLMPPPWRMVRSQTSMTPVFSDDMAKKGPSKQQSDWPPVGPHPHLRRDWPIPSGRYPCLAGWGLSNLPVVLCGQTLTRAVQG